MQCPRCQQENRQKAKFCDACGTPLTRTSEGSREGASYAELQRHLTDALDQQTATAEILRVISNSPSDIQPVFDAIAPNAPRLGDAVGSPPYRPDGVRLLLRV